MSTATSRIMLFCTYVIVLITALCLPTTYAQPAILDFGLIIPTHSTQLPNLIAGEQQHYFLNNLPMSQDGVLSSFGSLFSRNPAVTSTASSILLHVVRPIDGSPVNATTRTIRYISTTQLDEMISGEQQSIEQYNITVQAGDILAVSVVDNTIFLHAGPNNAGELVRYATVSVSPTVLSSREATFRVSAAPSTPAPNTVIDPTLIESSTHVMQLCAAGVIRLYGPSTLHATDSSYIIGVNRIQAMERPITYPGLVTSIRCMLYMNRPVSMYLVVLRRSGVDRTGPYTTVPALTSRITNVQSGVNMTLSEPVPVEQNDLFGFLVEFQNLLIGVTTTPNVAMTPRYMKELTTRPRSVASQITTDAVVALYYWDTPDTQWRVGADAQFQFTVLGVQPTTPAPTTPPPTTEPPTEPPTDAPTTPSRAVTQPPATGQVTGDPQFAGFHGQSFQFHGLADEHFNLISSPQLQLNAHFVYLAAGSCTYNDTLCFQHPGTYLDILGFTLPSITGDVHIKLVAGEHDKGLRMWMGPAHSPLQEIKLGQHQHGMTWKTGSNTADSITIKYNKHGQVHIRTNTLDIKVINSDMFFNLELALLDSELLRVGATKHTINEHKICHHDTHGHAQVKVAEEEDEHASHDHGMVEEALMKKYHADYPMHGLIGQTWRNVLVCNKHWIGGVQDYVVNSLFGADYYYNFYKH